MSNPETEFSEKTAAETVAEVAENLNKNIETFSAHQTNRIFGYNMAAKETDYLTQNEQRVLESLVNVDSITRQAKNWVEYLKEKFEKNDVVLLGEAHTVDVVEKQAVTEILETAKTAGITELCVELEPKAQRFFDNFFLKCRGPGLASCEPGPNGTT